MHESIGMHYQSYTATSEMHTDSVIHCLQELLRYLNQFQCIPHKIFTTYNSFYVFSEKHHTFSTETHGNAIFPHKSQKNNYHRNQKGTDKLSDVIFQD